MAKMRPDSKKGFPGGFLLFILAGILLFFGISTFTGGNTGKVSFSHQAEHLTNLNLTVPEENRKIAQNENLVTFSGRFRDAVPEESSDRYRYLELLDENHRLRSETGEISADLDALQKNVKDAADLYLHISGQSLPRSGYTVVGALYDTLERDSSVVIKSLSSRSVTTLPFVQKSLNAAQQKGDGDSLDATGREIRDLVSVLRSPALGIGSESIKQELKTIDSQLSAAADQTPEQQIRTYRNDVNQLATLIGELGREHDGVRLSQLRSVRNYVDELQQFVRLSTELDKNTALLDKSRANTANVIWFFNNQELSTRALEKQDPEVFGHWFAQAKQEWENFQANKGLVYRAPDQPRNTVLEKTFKSEEPSPNYFSYHPDHSACLVGHPVPLFHLLPSDERSWLFRHEFRQIACHAHDQRDE